jgi:hypothetical protein
MASSLLLLTPVKRDRADVTVFARKSFSTHYNGHRIEAFRGLAGRHAVITRDERQCNLVRHFGHVPRSCSIERQPV